MEKVVIEEDRRKTHSPSFADDTRVILVAHGIVQTGVTLGQNAAWRWCGFPENKSRGASQGADVRCVLYEVRRDHVNVPDLSARLQYQDRNQAPWEAQT